MEMDSQSNWMTLSCYWMLHLKSVRKRGNNHDHQNHNPPAHHPRKVLHPAPRFRAGRNLVKRLRFAAQSELGNCRYILFMHHRGNDKGAGRDCMVQREYKLFFHLLLWVGNFTKLQSDAARKSECSHERPSPLESRRWLNGWMSWCGDELNDALAIPSRSGRPLPAAQASGGAGQVSTRTGAGRPHQTERPAAGAAIQCGRSDEPCRQAGQVSQARTEQGRAYRIIRARSVI